MFLLMFVCLRGWCVSQHAMGQTGLGVVCIPACNGAGRRQWAMQRAVWSWPYASYWNASLFIYLFIFYGDEWIISLVAETHLASCISHSHLTYYQVCVSQPKIHSVMLLPTSTGLPPNLHWSCNSSCIKLSSASLVKNIEQKICFKPIR